jgi:predicted CxxxxCH...CXXCH cytochrome family protein
VTSATFPANCNVCHDVSAPSTKVGPVCQTCHVAASPLTSLDCTSCHAPPPDSGAPAGAAYPNIAGAHSTHIALDNTGSPVSCDTCHNGLGSGTLNHYNAAKSRTPPGDAAFPATYAAQTGASAFDNSAALSCSNVSCHGGQATPNWQTGAIDVDTQCSNCHAQGTAQFNSYNSGEHQFHVGVLELLCTFCHNTTTLAEDHFTTLADNTISPAVASATIGGGSTLISAGNYDPATQSCSPNTGVCHETRIW